MDFSSIYIAANRFEKLAQQDTYILYKKYVLDQFFNAFKNGKYTIIYDSVNTEYNPTLGSAGDLYGPTMTFDFIAKTNDPLPAIDAEVTKALSSSSIGDKVHAVNVEPNGPKKFTCNIQFNSIISGIE